MKLRDFVPLLTLALTLPALAQEPAPPTAPPEDLAQIDPKALKLLAKVAGKYEHAGYYSGVANQRMSALGSKPLSIRYRIAYGAGDMGVIAKSGEWGIERWVSDGHKILTTASLRPRQYIAEALSTSGSPKVARDEFFIRAQFQGLLADLLRGRIGHILLDPDLRSLSVEPTTEYGASQKLVITADSKDKTDTDSVTLFIGADLVLRRGALHEQVRNQPAFDWEETYSETVIAREPPAGFYESTSTVPPKNFKRVPDFDAASTTTNIAPRAR